MSQCSSCGAEILWAFTEAGARVPLNFRAERRFVPLGTTADRFKLVKTWTSHFATCPTADLHGKSRAMRSLLGRESKTEKPHDN